MQRSIEDQVRWEAVQLSSSILGNSKQALTKPPERFGIDRPEHLTLIDASRFLAPDYPWRVFHSSAGQGYFFVILIGPLRRW
jgi:hypothetical protein